MFNIKADHMSGLQKMFEYIFIDNSYFSDSNSYYSEAADKQQHNKEGYGEVKLC